METMNGLLLLLIAIACIAVGRLFWNAAMRPVKPGASLDGTNTAMFLGVMLGAAGIGLIAIGGTWLWR